LHIMRMLYKKSPVMRFRQHVFVNDDVLFRLNRQAEIIGHD